MHYQARKVSPYFLISTITLLIFSCLWLGVAINAHWISTIDQLGNELFRSKNNGSKIFIAFILTQFGGTLFLTTFSFLTLLAFLCVKKWQQASLFSVTVLFGALILPQIIKYIEMRPRPFSPLISISGYSFPSGHAAGASTFYGILLIILLLFYIENKAVKWLLMNATIIWIAAIMISRVYLGVHYLSDILAGGALGIFVISFSAGLYLKLDNVKKGVHL